MKINRIFFIILGFSLSCIIQIHAQQTIIKVSIDSTHLLIGEQTNIQLEVVQPQGKFVQFPLPKDTLMTGVEVLSISRPDTSDLGNNNIQIKQNYLVTSYDSAIYVLPPFEVIDGVDTIRSNQLGLKVSTYPVDVESKQFFDIKDVITPPFVLGDYAAIIWSVIGACILILIAWYLYEVKRGRRSLNIFKKTEIVKLPPHVVAINELEGIKQRKLWQQGLAKQYHSSITDTLRKYIEERFGTQAMEMTSGEILEKIDKISDADSVYDNLKQILQLGDFVKFAKYQPLPDENELSMMNAYLFVNQTKKEEIAGEVRSKELEESNSSPPTSNSSLPTSKKLKI